jgi:hypothetical protein
MKARWRQALALALPVGQGDLIPKARPRLIIERFDPPSTRHAARVRSRAGAQAADELAGRHVWFAAASPRGRNDALALRERLRAGSGIAADPLDVDEGEYVHDVAFRLDAMLSGAWDARSTAGLSAADRAGCAEAAAAAEAALRREVGADDVVVVHDAAAALVAQAVRERGAHVVWYLQLGRAASPAAARAALEFLRRYTGTVDAYISGSVERAPGGRVVRRVTAVMPRADILAAKETLGPDLRDPLVWSSALADVLAGDRDEHVGGRRHVRPAVAAR